LSLPLPTSLRGGGRVARGIEAGRRRREAREGGEAGVVSS
jgi:hypothetical protein